MPRSELAGSRIRERRLSLGIKQAELARQVGISAPYLNLIEHNRRAIAGKLMADLARALEIDPSHLADGAEIALLTALREAHERMPEAKAEVDHADYFAARFPGWAGLARAQSLRISQLERMVDTLQDRLSHDPFLSTAMHDVLTTVTSLQSAAAILAAEDSLEPAWRKRFEANIFDDSQRLSEAGQALVAYLDNAGNPEAEIRSPQEDMQAGFARAGFHFPTIEADPSSDEAREKVLAELELAAPAARELAKEALQRYAKDAAQMPLSAFQAKALEVKEAPLELAQAFGVPLSAVLRRLAAQPQGLRSGEDGPIRLRPAGLVSADSSGTFLHRQPLAGFEIPQFGAACPLWALFQALMQPGRPIRMVVEQSGPTRPRFETFAVAEPRVPSEFGQPVVLETTMLIRPLDGQEVQEGLVQVGSGCRVCPREGCSARREPSILRDAI
ncbi:MAG: short-chain fatty acyl-CoA regulator family protein [Pseudomonadota bacterium]